MSNTKFLLDSKTCAGRLLAVTKGRVENYYSVFSTALLRHVNTSSAFDLSGGLVNNFSMAWTADFE